MSAALQTDEMHRESQEGSTQERVAKNATIYFCGQVVSWITTFAYMSIVPRVLGEEMCGRFALAGTACTTATGFLSLGLEQYLVKEVGRDRTQTERLLRAVLGLRVVTIVPAVVFPILTLFAIHADRLIWILGLLGIAAGPMGLLSGPMRSVMAGWEDAKRVVIYDLGGSVLNLVGLPLLIYGPIIGSIGLSIVGLVISILNLMIMIVFVGRHIRLRPVVDIPIWKYTILGGFPFLINNYILILYSAVNVFVLKHYTDNAAVGVYSQAGKLFGTFLFIPTALGQALLPSLARMAHQNHDQFRAVQTRVLGILIILGLPVMATMIVLARPFCLLLYGSHRFVAMPLVLQWFALSIIPMYVVSTIYQFLIAQNKNTIWTGFLLVSVGLFALLSSLLTPWTLHTMHNGVIGTVLATFLTESCSVVFAFVLLKTNPLSWELLGRVGRALLATAGMVLVMWLTQRVFILVPAALGTATFCLLAWVLRVLPSEDQGKIAHLVRSKLHLGT